MCRGPAGFRIRVIFYRLQTINKLAQTKDLSKGYNLVIDVLFSF